MTVQEMRSPEAHIEYGEVQTKPETHEVSLQVDLVICRNPNSMTWKEAEAIEAAVFIEKKYVESAEEMSVDYEPYQASSTMIIAKSGEKIVGCIRLISYDENVGFKTSNDIAKGELEVDESGMNKLAITDPRKVIEVATISLDPEYRAQEGADTFMITSLYGAIYAQALKNDTPNILASFDEDYFGRFKGLFGVHVEELGPAKDYMGSKTVPSIMNIDELKVYFEQIGASDYVAELLQLGQAALEEN